MCVVTAEVNLKGYRRNVRPVLYPCNTLPNINIFPCSKIPAPQHDVTQSVHHIFMIIPVRQQLSHLSLSHSISFFPPQQPRDVVTNQFLTYVTVEYHVPYTYMWKSVLKSITTRLEVSELCNRTRTKGQG